MNRLTLKAEQLTELSDSDLSGVAAGAAGTLRDCLTGYYPSLNAPCTELIEPLTTVIGSTH